jgi:3-hydroxy-9,10-secoandrosta-1,3,5(10)-triene-9,17-dione monooxygenase
VPPPDQNDEVFDLRLALLPVSAGQIERTWRVAGMQGSGRDTLVVEEMWVPQHRVLSYSALVADDRPCGHEPGSIYAASVVPFLTVAMVGPLLGMAEAALDYTTNRLARGKAISAIVYPDAALSPSVGFKVADAALRIDTARLHCAHAVSTVQGGADAGRPLNEAQRAQVRMDVAMAARCVVEAVRFLLGCGRLEQLCP